MSKNVSLILAGIAACLIIVLVVAFVVLLGEVTPNNGGDLTAAEGDSVSIAEAATTNSEAAASADAVATATKTAEPTELPAPPVLPTDTLVPTEAPTDTPEPTATPEATTTPEPTATATNAPVVIQPTAVPPTAVPPTSPPPPTAVPVNTNGLSGSFTLLPDSQYTVNGNIWFRFTVTNSSGQNVPYEALGALPKKDGAIRGDLFKRSWGGNNDSIGTGGLTADDWIKLPETGNYTLMLAICFDALSACQSGASSWVILSPEVPVTIN